jgi:hypothetical protein
MLAAFVHNANLEENLTFEETKRSKRGRGVGNLSDTTRSLPTCQLPRPEGLWLAVVVKTDTAIGSLTGTLAAILQAAT